MALNGPGIEISFAWEGKRGPEELARSLVTFGQNVSDLSPAWEKVGTVLLKDFARNFDNEGGEFGQWSRWPQLAPSTVAQRIRRYGQARGAHPILEREGRLRRGVTQRGSPENIFEVTPTRLKLGTTVPYAGYHNSSAPRKRLPRRAIVALSAARQGFGGGGATNSLVSILNGYLVWQLAQQNLQASGAQAAANLEAYLNPQ